MIHIKAPSKYPTDTYKLFLGGSIDMGSAEKWQERIAAELQHYNDFLVLLNPRRDDWDSSWKQDPSPGTQFYEQVDWELVAQERANKCLYYFADNSSSPITLLELGLFYDKAIVYCTPAFYRYGNVRMVCDRYEIPLYENYDLLVAALKEQI